MKSRLPVMRQMSRLKGRRDYPALQYGGMAILPVMIPNRVERFWARVGPPNHRGCREWNGSPGPNGYGLVQGSVRYRGYSFLAHRVAWALSNNQEPPPGLIVRHSCDNPSCCEPAHLLIGTHADNTADMIERGRANFAGGSKGRTGAAASAARYTQGQRNVAIAMRFQNRLRYADIVAATGVCRATLSRWFSEHQKAQPAAR